MQGSSKRTLKLSKENRKTAVGRGEEGGLSTRRWGNSQKRIERAYGGSGDPPPVVPHGKLSKENRKYYALHLLVEVSAGINPQETLKRE